MKTCCDSKEKDACAVTEGWVWPKHALVRWDCVNRYAMLEERHFDSPGPNGCCGTVQSTIRQGLVSDLLQIH